MSTRIRDAIEPEQAKGLIMGKMFFQFSYKLTPFLTRSQQELISLF
ncbi:MAG: hypothetical protein KBG16_07365 [Methanospirillum sp.]|nr:hypothetical protein [Methanospirillum hungatei]MBP9008468.1 hypothetical protein [Methanospirillum sp.]MCA1915950.1 hypothetical protein [Methanospirillum hungatei]